jgi:hypothetical protein
MIVEDRYVSDDEILSLYLVANYAWLLLLSSLRWLTLGLTSG